MRDQSTSAPIRGHQEEAIAPPSSALSGATGDPAAMPEVEAVAGRQRVEHDAADHDRPVAVDLPGVGLGRGAVDDRDAPPADDLHDPIRADDAGRVLVDAEAEQRWGSGR